MLNGFTIGRNYAGDSMIHRLAAQTKVLIAATLMLGVLGEVSVRGLALLGAYLIILLAIARVPLAYYSRNMPPLVLGAMIILAASALAYPGHAWFRFGPLLVTREGLFRGLIVGYRVLFAFLTMSMLTLTTSPLAISHTLASALAPLAKIGFPIQELATVSALSLAYIPLVVEDAKRIIDSHANRGGDFHSRHLLRRAATMWSVVVVLMAATVRRAADLATAMEIRCYSGARARTSYREEKLTAGDICLLVMTGLIAAGTVWL